MGARKPEDTRTIAIAAHGGAGKTSLVEAMLYDVNVISRMGRIEEGNTVSDFDPEEQKRQISINTSIVTFDYKDKTFFILDTPGYADFVGDLRSGMRVADSAVILISGVDGVEVQTEKAFDFADDFSIPVVFFVNKLDRDNSDYNAILKEIRQVLTDRAISLYLPIGKESNFKGVVNVLTGKAYLYKGDGSKDYEETSFPAELEEELALEREALIERIVEVDDDLMMRYLEGEELKEEELIVALKKAILDRIVMPVLPGSAIANVGIFQLLDVMSDVLPSPLDMFPRKAIDAEGEEVEVKPDPDGKFSSLCFKVMVDPYVGKLSFVRVFSGTLTLDQSVYVVNKKTEERIGSLRFMRGKDGKDVKEITVGDIVAIPKLQTATVGDTIAVKGVDFVFPPIQFPDPVYSLAIVPKSRADEDKLSNAIHRILEEDPTLRYEKNAETGDHLLSGMGDLHLDIVLSRIKERYGVELETRLPKVPYRETIRKPAKAQGRYKKQTGGRGQYGDVWLELQPLERGAGVEFEDRIVGGVVPKQYVPAVEKGLREAAQKGVLAGYPAIDFKAILYDGSYHEVDSSEMAFKIAASMGFKKCFVEASPVLLEPIMNVEVVVPEEYLGDVMGDLNSRRGRIMGIEGRGRFQVVKAQVPLAEMFRYAIVLRSMTSGRGSFSMEFSHYEEVPQDLAKKIIAQVQAEAEGEAASGK